MIELLSYLHSNYGKPKKKEHSLLFRSLPKISRKSFFHTLYEPIDLSAYCDKQKELFAIDKSYESFLKQTNGCRLFFNNILIFGKQMHHEDYYEPLDFENENNVLKTKGCKCAIIGIIGYDYLLGYDNGELSIIKKDDYNELRTFDSFETFIDYYTNELCVRLAEKDVKKKKRPVELMLDIGSISL